MKKFVTYSVVVATLVWALGLGAIVPVSAAYTPSAGDYVKTADNTAVYYIGAEGKRHLFSNLVTFRSWDATSWGDLVDSGALQVISQDDFDSLEVGSNVTVRPGVNLVKFDNSAKVYAVTPGAVLVALENDAAAEALYGANWSDSVVTVQNSFETNYTKSGTLTADSELPDGSLVKYEGSEDIYYISDGMKRPVSDDAFVANEFWDSSVRTIPTSMTYEAGESITGEEAAIANVDGAGTSSNNDNAVAGDVTVRLSADTAAPTTYLSTQALAEFLTVEVTNNNSTDVEIDSFKIERGGLASDTPFNSVAAYEDSILGDQIGLNKTLNSSHQATFGDNVTVPAGTTKKIVIVGNMGTAVASDAAKLGLVSMALKGGGTVNGLDSTIWGNVMGQTGSVSIATVTVANGSANPSATSIKVGDTNVDIAQIKITNDSSTEKVQVEKVVFKQAGTVADSDVEKYKLINSEDNTILATAPQVDKYITFVLDTPLEIGKAKNKSLMAQAVEINDGSSRTIDLDIQRETDILVKDLTYNAYIRIDDATKWPNTSAPLFSASADQTIGNGTVKIEASNDFAAANIAEGKDGIQIGEWLFTVKGEEVDITQIATRIATSTSAAATGPSDITNGIFFLVDSDTALTGATDAAGTVSPGITSTDTITLSIGIHKIGLKVDLNSDFSNNDTLQAGITAANLTVTGNTTGNDITPTPSAEVQSALQTIKTAKLTISNSINPPAQNVIRGANVEAANIVLDASASGDDLTMTQLKTDLYTTTMNPDEITSITLWDGATQILTSNEPIPTSSTASDTVTTTWSFASPLTVTKGTVKTLTVKVTTGGSTSASDIFAVGTPNSTTAGAVVKDSEGEDVTPTYTSSNGQSMTIQTTGTLTISRSDEYSSGMLVGNTSGVALGKLNLSAKNGDVDVEKMYVTVAAANGGGTDELEALYLYDGSTLVATATITSTNQNKLLFNMESDPYTIAVNTTKELTIKADTAVIANDGTATNATANTGFTLSAISTELTAKTNGTAATVTSATLTFPTYRIVKSVPTVVVSSTGASLTGNTTYDLIDVTVTADAKGPIGLYKMTFQMSSTTVAVGSYEVYESGTLVATEATDGISTYYMNDGSGSEVVEVYFNLGGSLGGQLRKISAGDSKKYTLRGVVTGYTAGTSNSVSVSIAGDNADDATDYYKGASTIDATSDADFIWSDLSYGNTSTTAGSSTTTTVQWMNGAEIDSSGGLLGTTSSPKSI